MLTDEQIARMKRDAAEAGSAPKDDYCDDHAAALAGELGRHVEALLAELREARHDLANARAAGQLDKTTLAGLMGLLIKKEPGDERCWTYLRLPDKWGRPARGLTFFDTREAAEEAIEGAAILHAIRAAKGGEG